VLLVAVNDIGDMLMDDHNEADSWLSLTSFDSHDVP